MLSMFTKNIYNMFNYDINSHINLIYREIVMLVTYAIKKVSSSVDVLGNLQFSVIIYI